MTFGELFSEISYAYEVKYPPELWEQDGIRYANFYKGTATSDGKYEYKGNYSTFDPKLFWKVEMMAKLLLDDPTLTVLYGQK